MAKNLNNVNVLTDTFNGWMLRTNDVIDLIRTEVITANSSLGVTGSPGVPQNARLWGAFTSNTLTADALTIGANNFVANSSSVLIGPSVRLYAGPQANGGVVGQVLTSSAAGVEWTTVPGTGTLTSVNSGNGLSFAVGGLPADIITGQGTIAVRAGTGIIVNADGVSVNTAYLNTVIDAPKLQGNTWVSPGLIGNTTPSTGRFTTLTANTYRLEGLSETSFEISRTRFVTPGHIDVTTPSPDTGGVKVRLNGPTGTASIQINNVTTEVSKFSFTSNGEATYSNNFIFNGTAKYGTGVGFFPNTEIGYKTIPQLQLTSDATANSLSSGAHYYKTSTLNINLSIANNATVPLPIGTAITIVNDGTAGEINIANTAGVTLQLGGSLVTGPRKVVPGGIATALKVQTDKWIVSGSGVV